MPITVVGLPSTENRLADDRRIAAKGLSPERVAQHDDRRLVETIVARRQEPAALRRDAEQREQIPGHERLRSPERPVAIGDQRAAPGQCGEPAQRFEFDARGRGRSRATRGHVPCGPVCGDVRKTATSRSGAWNGSDSSSARRPRSRSRSSRRCRARDRARRRSSRWARARGCARQPEDRSFSRTAMNGVSMRECYSYLSASTGSTRAARSAGM